MALVVGASLLSGCAHHFKQLPDASELDRPIDSIWNENPELRACKGSSSRFWWTPIWEMPYAQDLLDKWGEPSSSYLSWWTLLGGIVIHPMTKWEWQRSDKVVTVLVDHPIFYGYQAHVWMVWIEPTGPVEPPATSGP